MSIAAGLVLAAAGLRLLARPLTALGVLGWYIGASCVVSGLADLASVHGEAPPGSGRAGRRGWESASAAMWVVGGVAVLVRVGRDVDLLGPLVSLLLIGSGLAALARLATGPSPARWLAAATGLSECSFGLLGLLWPDATLVVIAVLFGGRTAAVGLALVRRGAAGALAPSRARPEAPARRRGSALRWAALHWTAAALVLLLAVSALAVSHRFRAGVPVADAFYDAPPGIGDTPGRLVRWEPYRGDLPAGMTGYRLLYVTTDAAGHPVLASGALAVPTDAAGPAPLIDWAHGTVGVARGCAPSIGRDAITEQGMPAMDALARNGWAMVASDYPGMGAAGAFPYLIGEGEGRAVLDAGRAARQVPGVRIADETVIWGHSQGGHAALWAGQLAPAYAPDLHVLGTAALSPASDPLALARTVLAHPGAPGASLAVSFVTASYAGYYDDIRFDQVVAASAKTIVREAAARCTGEAGTLLTILAGLAVSKDQPIVRAGAIDGPFGERLRQNIPAGPWGAPVLIAQGEADEVIPYSINQSYAADLKRRGAEVELRGYPGGTHMSVLDPGAPLSAELEAWTKARLAGARPGD